MSSAQPPRFKAWKIRRELQRVRQQLKAIPEFFIEPWQRYQHDRQRQRMCQAHQGKVPVREKIALLLIYQPAGVADSILWTCEHLVQRGYAPLVVSNTPLAADDLDRLSPHLWRAVERPNFGYDFGGYRDGIWLLEQWQLRPEVLLVLNDSIWFPLDAHEDLLQRMESSPADFVGALQLDPLRQQEGVPARKRPFFGSFFLMFKRAAMEHSAFRRFWSGYRNTSNKYKTIRRGERGLSHALMDAGLRCEAMYTRQALDRHWESLDAGALRDALARLVTIDDRLQIRQAALLASQEPTEAWRKAAIDLALAITEKQNVLATAPHASLTVFRTPYLKKARDWNNLEALRHIRAWIDEGRLPPPHPSVRREIDRVLGSREGFRV